MGLNVFNGILGLIKVKKWRKANKCKRLLKQLRRHLTVKKIRINAIIGQSRVDIAQLLQNGFHHEVSKRVEKLYRDYCRLYAYEQLEGFCECICTNLDNISLSRKLSVQVNEAISTLIFAASRCGELHELHWIRNLFTEHFGHKFERANVELLPGNFVNSEMKHHLTMSLVTEEVKQQLKDEISTEFRRPSGTLQGNHSGDDSGSESQKQASITKFLSGNLKKLGTFWNGLFNGVDSTADSLTSTETNKITSQKSSEGFSSMHIPNSTQQNQDISSLPEEDYNGGHEHSILSTWVTHVSSKRYTKKNITEDRQENSRLDHRYAHPKLPDYDDLVGKSSEGFLSMHIPNGTQENQDTSSLPEEDYNGGDERSILSTWVAHVSTSKRYTKKNLTGDQQENSRLDHRYVHPKLPDYDDLVGKSSEGFLSMHIPNGTQENQDISSLPEEDYNSGDECSILSTWVEHVSSKRYTKRNIMEDQQEISRLDRRYVHPKLPDYDDLVAKSSEGFLSMHIPDGTQENQAISSLPEEDYNGGHELSISSTWVAHVSSKRYTKKNIMEDQKENSRLDSRYIHPKLPDYDDLVAKSSEGFLSMHIPNGTQENQDISSLPEEDYNGGDERSILSTWVAHVSSKRYTKKNIMEDQQENSRLDCRYVHPKLPDYDDLVAKFTNLRKCSQENSNDRRILKWTS